MWGVGWQKFCSPELVSLAQHRRTLQNPKQVFVRVKFVLLNAAANDPFGDDKTTGTEVLVYSTFGAAVPYAANICAAIAALGFSNRGVKERPELYVLKHTGTCSAGGVLFRRRC